MYNMNRSVIDEMTCTMPIIHTHTATRHYFYVTICPRVDFMLLLWLFHIFLFNRYAHSAEPRKEPSSLL